MSPARDGVVLLSSRGLGELPSIERASDCPAGTRVVVVDYSEHGDAPIEELRTYQGTARVIAWLDEADSAGIQAALTGGYDDIGFSGLHLEQRIDMNLHDVDVADAYISSAEAYAGLVRLIEEMTEKPDLQDVLQVAVLRMSELFDIDRVSVVLWKPGDEVGFVIMERDQALDNLVIRIPDYPELAEIIRSGEPLVISDVFGDSLLSGVRSKLESAKVAHRAAVLFPLLRQQSAVGALFLRSRDPLPEVEDKLLMMGRLIASVTSVAIGNAMEHELLLSEQRALLRDKEDVDRELEALRQFTEFFAQANDGILVTGPDGSIRYANAAAGAILGHEPPELAGKGFLELVSEHSRVLAERAFQGDSVGDSYGYVDLLIPTGDDEAVISAAIRRLREPEGVMVSFRDVTELREIESELRQTKEFLENLIQSSVDGIIAADVDGTIILFNRAAEQIVGMGAREVVGKVNVASLYPPDEAADVMKRLRSEAYGGRGRLSETRKELVTKTGDHVPINLTAAIIYEGDEEVATVGIFTDLRERLKVEEKLSQVQRKLQISERQAVAAELAGAAAHELNQPLTSILGYAEMLKRRIPSEDPRRKPVDVIARETERMATIVRKIGEITAYETTQYVGGSTILDLDPNKDQSQKET